MEPWGTGFACHRQFLPVGQAYFFTFLVKAGLGSRVVFDLWRDLLLRYRSCCGKVISG